jgi:gliding motility-associated lipoprotein GldH
MHYKIMRAVYILLFVCVLCSCGKTDLYEKLHAFPKQEWSASDSAVFNVTIKDSVTPHQLYLVFRHNDTYHFKNLWLQIQVKAPDTTYSIRRDFTLADNEKWLGTGMNDVYEHRVPFSSSPTLLKAGDYHFVFKQVMREDPLENVVNVGLRIEKIRE